MIRVTALARNDSLPWEEALFELFWGGTAAFAWSCTAYLTYNYMPRLWFFSTPFAAVKMAYGSSTFVVPIAIGLYLLTRQSPDIWAIILQKCISSYWSGFSLFVRSRVLVRLTHLFNGFLISSMRRWQRRNIQARREDPTIELLTRTVYQYNPIQEDHFRLLRVSRSWIMAQFECELVSFYLKSARLPEYTAVSYAWGPDPSKPRAIGVGGKSLRVTESAFQVVQSLAPVKGERYIWVDFICINQEDVMERASQVKRMGFIYSKATQVTVLLNTVTPVDYDDSDLVVHHLNKMNKKLREDAWTLDQRVSHHRQAQAGTPPVSPGWAALNRLFEREYWSRAWVVQEIAMAQKLIVVYGDNELSWDDLSNFAYSFQDPDNGSALDLLGVMFSGGSIPLISIMKIILITNMRRDFTEGGGLSIHDLFFHGLQFNATDPRDNIYAFLGLIGAPIPQQIEPDYTISALDLFLNATRFLMATDQPLWFLNFAGRGFGDRSIQSRFCNLNDSDLPSWVPNWSSALKKALFLPLQPIRQEEHTLPKIQHSGKVLEVHAAVFDIVVHVCEIPFNRDPGTHIFKLPPDQIETMSQVGREFKAFLDAFESHVPDPYPTGIPREEVAWRVLCGSKTTDPEEIAQNTQSFVLLQKEASFAYEVARLAEPPGDQLAQQESPTNILEELTNLMSSLPGEGTEKSSIESGFSHTGSKALFQAGTRFVFTMGKHCAGRKVGFTQNGHIVLVPPLTQHGDRICYIAHGKSPFVLRPASGEAIADLELGELSYRDKFELMGDCYVHDVRFKDGDSVEPVLIV
ncbi:hypothetical protein N0V90_008470 [Kalmusia sp. IMI 367209]|nr:hypothetical protein N0V90_008470 [Kalmusia sp. IMI 367209]